MSVLSVKDFQGFFNCKSTWVRYHNTCNNFSYEFDYGTYILQGEIDAGGWAFCYSLCPDYSRKKSDIILSNNLEISLLNQSISLSEIRTKTCYLDETKEKFNDEISRKTVKQIVENNLKKNSIDLKADEVRDMFCIDPLRFDRKLSQVGNEIYNCKTAIGFTSQKLIFCFPWISKKFFEYRKIQIEMVCDILTKLNKIVLLPTSYEFTSSEKYKFINIDELFKNKFSKE